MKAVLFDVYGTILSGHRVTDRDRALLPVLQSFGIHHQATIPLSAALDQEISRLHRQADQPYPEVDIREVWKTLLPELTNLDAFALAAEQAIHPIRLRNGARSTIEKAHRRELAIGIISNAQAYTRTLLSQELRELWNHFDPDLLFFSYQYRASKPGPRLFEEATKVLARRNITPQQTLIVGDSTANDIIPAQLHGFQSHLVGPGLAWPMLEATPS